MDPQANWYTTMRTKSGDLIYALDVSHTIKQQYELRELRDCPGRSVNQNKGAGSLDTSAIGYMCSRHMRMSVGVRWIDFCPSMTACKCVNRISFHIVTVTCLSSSAQTLSPFPPARHVTVWHHDMFKNCNNDILKRREFIRVVQSKLCHSCELFM